jgi:integrase
MASIQRRRGSGIWTAFFRDQDGRQHCRSTETTERKLAQKIADSFEAAAQKRRTLAQLQRVLAEMHELVNGEPVNSRLSVRAFISEWLELRAPEIATPTSDFYNSSAEKFLLFLGERADAPLANVTKRDLIDYRNLLTQNLAPRTVNHRIKFLKMVFKAARRDSLIHEDPSEFVEPVRSVSHQNRHTFTLEEIRAVLSQADPEWRSMVLFGLYTGQRLGDIASLCWNNIDPVAGEIRFVATKTGRSMILPLAPALAKHVLSLPVAGECLETPLHPRAYRILQAQGRTGSLSNQFSDLLAQAGLREKKSHRKIFAGRSARRQTGALSFHNLRHTATSFLHEAGIPAAVAQAFVGHDSEAIHALYTHVGTDSLRRAAQALPELL